MARNVRLRELLLGVEGLALLRNLYDGSDVQAGERVAEVAALLADDSLDHAEAMTEADARAGYAAWAQTYDEPGNPIIAIEEPAVWALLDRVPPGRALDAACGTGRHSHHLVAAGHEVVGVDLTPQMLARWGRGLVAQADLVALPFGAATFDLAVCGLALAHVADPGAAVTELAGVLRPGGLLVVSVIHPFQAYLGWHAPFEDALGRRGFVREHTHSHADYLAAFAQAGLAVRGCVEPRLGAEQVRAKRRAFRHIPAATLAAYEGLPGVLIWEAEKP